MTAHILRILAHIVVPSTTPTPFLSVVGACFLWSVPVALLVLFGIRLGFRRGKGVDEL